MYQLNNQYKKNIQKNTSLTVEEIGLMDIEETDAILEKKIGKKLYYEIAQNLRLIGRGSVYLFLDRFLPINHIDEKIAKI